MYQKCKLDFINKFAIGHQIDSTVRFFRRRHRLLIFWYAYINSFVLPHWWRARKKKTSNVLGFEKFNVNAEAQLVHYFVFFSECVWLSLRVLTTNTNSKKTKKNTSHQQQQQQLPCKKGHKLVFPPNHLPDKKHRLDWADGAGFFAYYVSARARSHTHII